MHVLLPDLRRFVPSPLPLVPHYRRESRYRNCRYRCPHRQSNRLLRSLFGHGHVLALGGEQRQAVLRTRLVANTDSGSPSLRYLSSTPRPTTSTPPNHSVCLKRWSIVRSLFKVGPRSSLGDAEVDSWCLGSKRFSRVSMNVYEENFSRVPSPIALYCTPHLPIYFRDGHCETLG